MSDIDIFNQDKEKGNIQNHWKELDSLVGYKIAGVFHFENELETYDFPVLFLEQKNKPDAYVVVCSGAERSEGGFLGISIIR
tara:strand:+ start:3182 stop:3427 length:246 start_codon:yes stop_codon:yes gene_type:complete